MDLDRRLQEDIELEEQFEGIIGQSTAMRSLWNQIRIVAPTGATVLILGETGSGKELIARAIHNRSSRRHCPFVKVNCVAIPAGLIESELFGHERGAFTGALSRRTGRFEAANGGTLFLDEIGDVPPELQPKLLRVLQEREFERVGGTHTSRVDVRVVAATNRNLPQMMAAKEFRADLYYRLNVFPIQVPALRERSEDIPSLVRCFVKRSAERMNKCINIIPTEVMDAFRRYSWPGNVRELENIIERAVILSPGKVLRASPDELWHLSQMAIAASAEKSHAQATLKDMEREHIIRVLAATNWVVGGPSGAGARLGLPRTTLIAKMQRLGITRVQSIKPGL
jgi:formate hydrogenlyase transcriptional activator